MTVQRQALGRRGEAIAAQFLKDKHYEILERNYRRHRGEIDLIARDGQCLVFVEVKSSRSARMGHAIYRVDRRKQRQIGKVALTYFREQRLVDQDTRFDVVTVTFLNDHHRIEHFENAFWLEGPL